MYFTYTRNVLPQPLKCLFLHLMYIFTINCRASRHVYTTTSNAGLPGLCKNFRPTASNLTYPPSSCRVTSPTAFPWR